MCNLSRGVVASSRLVGRAMVLSPQTTIANKIMTHKQMIKKMLKNPAVKAETDRLNSEEFAILDKILAALKQAGLSQAQIAKRMGTHAQRSLG